MSTEKKNLLQWFLHWEKHTPDAVYLTQPYPDGSVIDYTWREVGDQARRMASYLQSLQFKPNSNILLVGKNSAHWIMADLAIWMAGHVSVPLYPTMNAAGARYVLEDCQAPLLFLGKLDGKVDGWNDMQHAFPADLPMISLPLSPRADLPKWLDLITTQAPLQEIANPAWEDLATIVYTSGSTGNPKGVMHSYKSMTAASTALNELWKIDNNERMLSYLPLAHVAERAGVESTSLRFGFHVYFADALDTFQADLKRARPTIFFSVPRLWAKFYISIAEKLPLRTQKILFSLPIISSIVKKKLLKEMGLNHVKVAITGSAPLATHIMSWYRKLGLELLDCYGMTENFGTSHAARVGQTRLGYVGSPAPGSECRIAADGSIEVKSAGQMLGYYKMPEKTQEEMTADGFFKTGDCGEIDELGRLKITGRIKEIFKTSKGKYVSPQPIENNLNNHPKIEVVCVVGSDQPQPFALMMIAPDIEHSIRSSISAQENLTEELKDLLNSVNAQLEAHEKLAFLVIIKDQWTMENGLLTPTMKIKRALIEARYLPKADAWANLKQAVIWE